MHGDQKQKTRRAHTELARERRLRGLSRKQVATIVGRSSQLIGAYERGDILPPLRLAMMLEILYRCQIAGLYLPLYRQLHEQVRAAEATVRARKRGPV